MRHVIVFVVGFCMGSVAPQAIMIVFVYAQGIIGLVIDLRLAPLLVDDVVRIAGLQAQGLLVVPFVHAVGVQSMSFVEEQPLFIEGSADARLRQKGVERDFLYRVVYQYALLAAEVGAVVVGLVVVDALIAFAQLQGIDGTFPK